MEDLIFMLKSMEPKLFELVTSISGKDTDEILKVIILVIDDLHFTLLRYEQLKKNE